MERSKQSEQQLKDTPETTRRSLGGNALRIAHANNEVQVLDHFGRDGIGLTDTEWQMLVESGAVEAAQLPTLRGIEPSSDNKA